MSFRIIAGWPVGAAASEDKQCDKATEAFATYRRLIRKRVSVKGILDLRGADQRQITGAELEAIAQRERNDGYKAAQRQNSIHQWP